MTKYFLNILKLVNLKQALKKKTLNPEKNIVTNCINL